MLKIILGFIPWFLYSILVSTLPSHHLIAVSAALASTVLLDTHELKKGFILAWGTLAFFVFLLLASFYIPNQWLEQHANLISNAALAAIVWFSLLINKPFTLQYAREHVDPQFWSSPLFIRINQWISLVWGLCFLACTLISALGLSYPAANQLLVQYAPTALILLTVWFTKVFPDWYKQKQMNSLASQAEQKIPSNPFLQGNFAPVHEELSSDNLTIEGQLPPDLTGVYMRNGANPDFTPFSYTYPFDGDGMLHAIYIAQGKAQYKNRYILTDQLAAERRLGKAVYGGVACPVIRDEQLLNAEENHFPVKIGRFIHIIRHKELYLALHESFSAYVVRGDLSTVGEWNPSQTEQAIEVNAHTRLDPKTNELYLISYHSEPFMTCHVLDKDAQLTQSIRFDVPFASMVHDFVLTQHYVVIFLCPVTVNFANMGPGKDFFQWQPELKTQIALLDRANLNGITWIETEAFFTFHFANAYELNGDIIVDHARYPCFDEKNLGSAHLYRSIINIKNKRCTHEQRDQYTIEFPRINEAYNSLPYRYIYSAANLDTHSSSDDVFHSLIKYDLETGQSEVHDFGSNYEIGEAVFAPKVGSRTEDEGYLMLFVYDKKANHSNFVLLDAQNISKPPLALIKLPRIPHGLHGSWFADA